MADHQIGHLLDRTSSEDILGLAKSTQETTSELAHLESQLASLQNTLEQRDQWHPLAQPSAIPCSTDFLDLSDLSTAVGLLADIVKYSDPGTRLTPQETFAKREWTWDPLWREFFSSSLPTDGEPATALYLSRWYFDARREIWQHANMAESEIMPDDAQLRLGSWEDWQWDTRCGEWGLDVSYELEDLELVAGAKLWVFASKWQEREGVWVYVGARGE
ncbi:hypothetical protein C7974DRAFT_317746 [Boeremia exigua]|uniref:uncharacterized protein n=1 Tax=Boeremia exigua TaxID=749465 RepID=UPI001E8CDACD|nr:uncharacterized protein C7974DRAFT_317746 [Boeremia exigua]KAH6618953.1 hypothetical protein C7974DRAFT_317746 [Boeremia exigua]